MKTINLAGPRPERKMFENPLAWWKGTPFFMWNFEYGGIGGIWAGVGEAEALGELVFDNLATLLGITGLMIGFFLNVKIYYAAINISPEYAASIVETYTDYYFQRAIPGTAFGLLFGNFAYAWQAGRLAKKEGRTDVTAQPYGINTTGAYITLGAVNLTALFDQTFDSKNLDKAFGGDMVGAGQDVAEKAWATAVSVNFCVGIFEVLGCMLGEPLRFYFPKAALYSLLTGVGFVYLAFGPMLSVAAEPIMCLVPLFVVLVGFFGKVQYKIGNTGLTIPIALVAVLLSVIFGWSGACKKKAYSIDWANYAPGSKLTSGWIYNYGDRWADEGGEYVTCTGTSKHSAHLAFEAYAGKLGEFGGGVFSGLSMMGQLEKFVGVAAVVGVVGFGATMAAVESASAAGDDYPMAETLIIDGVGTMLAACFGSFYGTTAYIGHPTHKALGAKRGYSVINGIFYFIFLLSGMFPWLYNVIPGCANGALLVFVGLLVGQQAFEDCPKRHYPALLFGLMPCVANWAKLYVDPGAPQTAPDGEVFAGIAWTEITGGDAGNWGATGVGIHMMGGGGGEWFCLIFTALFCFCIDRQFLKAAVLCAAATFGQATMGLVSMFNMPSRSGTMGSEKAGFYSADKDMNFGWMWSVALAMATVFFLIHYGLQKIGAIEPPIDGTDSNGSMIVGSAVVKSVAPASAPGVEVVEEDVAVKNESEA